jgi:DNA-binding NtrC family response regulator
VILPIIGGPEPRTTTRGVSAALRATGKSVLVVDDERYIRDLLKQVLSERGHLVKTASTADDAVKLLEERRFDAVVIDIKMPGMGGKELYTHFEKSRPELTTIMLFITGDVLSDDTRAFLETNACRYIEKPFKIEAFIRALDGVLGG